MSPTVHHDKKRPCSAIIGDLCIIPLGGVVGLFAAIFGFVWLNMGFSNLLDALNKMGANLDEIGLDVYFNMVGPVVIIADLFIVLYGFREKVRTRCNILGHHDVAGLGCLIKFFIKMAVHITVVGALFVAMILMILVEFIWVIFLAVDASCDTGGSSAQDIIEIFSSDSGSVTEICDAVSDGTTGAYQSFIGALIVTVAEIVILAYWMKYSTLAMVPAFYTTGDYTKTEAGADPKGPSKNKIRGASLDREDSAGEV